MIDRTEIEQRIQAIRKQRNPKKYWKAADYENYLQLDQEMAGWERLSAYSCSEEYADSILWPLGLPDSNILPFLFQDGRNCFLGYQTSVEAIGYGWEEIGRFPTRDRAKEETIQRLQQPSNYQPVL